MKRIFSRTACKKTQPIGKHTVRAMLQGLASYEFFQKLTDDQWDVISFDPYKREVCIVLYNNSGNKQITVLLPYISWGI